MSKIKSFFLKLKIIILMNMCRLIAIPFPRKNWVICERGDDAQDNGYWFYRYIKDHHPTTKVYYIIDSKSADYEKVKDDAVQINSLKSYWILATAQKFISSHYASGFNFWDVRIFRLCGLHKKFYFLQHGVIKDNIPALYAANAPMRLFVCGAKPEYDYVRAQFGHSENVVQYTGLPRFDHLHDIKEKAQIVVMPTWRNYIKNEEQFLQSDFYLKWQGLLNNQMLIDYIQKKNIQLVFYMHYQMQEYMHLFNVRSQNILLGRKEVYDVQSLLKESSILITDYSSVFFDFAYMKKPVIYYQFDEDIFFQKHYLKGYFDYREIGFGEVCTDELQVVDNMVNICENSMKMEKKFRDRTDVFFPLYDSCNCERIYRLIDGDKNER